MSEAPAPLQFDKAEFQEPQAGLACAVCAAPIPDVYFAAGGKTICGRCRAGLLASWEGGSPAGRVAKATAFGLAGGLAGAVVWFAVRRLFNLEIGFIAILVGWLVGKGMQKGHDGRGGRGYQVLGVAITYLCIAANFVPDIYQAFGAEADPLPPPLRAILAFPFALALPFIDFQVLGTIIIAIGLWEAWRQNREGHLAITGPFQVKPADDAADAGAPPAA